MDKYFQKACKQYSKALSLNPRNLYAANGIGIGVAEQGATSQARIIFAKVREASPNVNAPDFSINFGHLFMMEGAYAQAAQMYEEALKQAKDDPATMLNILLFLANAYFRQTRYRQAISTLQQAVRAAPQCLFIWSNLALVMELEAIACLNADKSNKHAFQESHANNNDKKNDGEDVEALQHRAKHYRSRVTAVAHAEQLLSTSMRLFNWLSTARAEPSHFGSLTYAHSQRMALKHKTHSEKLLSIVRTDLENVRKLEGEFTRMWKDARTRQLEEQERKRIAEEEAAERSRREKMEQLKMLEQEDEERQRELNETHARDDIDRRESKKKHKHRSRKEAEKEEEEEEEEEEEAKMTDDSGNEEENNHDDDDDADLFGGADVGEENRNAEPPTKRHRLHVIEDDDDDDEEEKKDDKNGDKDK